MTRITHLVLFVLLYWATVPVDAQIFKYEDDEGNIVFTDTPPDRGNADSETSNPDKPPEIIEISEPNTFKNDRQPYSSSSNTRNSGALREPDYAPIEIAFPKEDESIRENTGNVRVAVAGQTTLLPGHTLQIVLDGSVTTLPGSGTFTLPNLDRGTHVVRVDIVDHENKIVLSGSPRTFHLQRFFIKK